VPENKRNDFCVVRKAKFFKAESVPFWALTVFLVLTFLTGGASRADVQSLIILRPAAAIFCGIALWSLRWSHVQENRFLFGMAAAIFALVGSHLIPLPPSIWGALPGREIITEIDKTAELGAVWRPISMVPPATWNAFYSLFVPLAILLFGVQLDQEERFKLLPVVLGLALLSSFIGLLQLIGDPQGALYFYSITNNGSAVGLFANRNHQAILLSTLFPMLAVYASAGVRSEEQLRVRGLIALAAGAVLIPLLLIIGSRAGLILGILCLISVTIMYRKPKFLIPKKRKHQRFDPRFALLILGALFLGVLTIVMSRAEALQRLIQRAQIEDDRWLMWQPISQMAWKYFPAGSGVGSFVEAYQINEPYELLNITYLNHAHNDWLEIYMTTGVAGLGLIILGCFFYIKTALQILRAPLLESKNRVCARLGVIIILIFALGSIGDYPLRTPSLVSVFVIAALWLTASHDAPAKSASTP
jgi:O-antigen ligase